MIFTQTMPYCPPINYPVDFVQSRAPSLRISKFVSQVSLYTWFPIYKKHIGTNSNT